MKPKSLNGVQCDTYQSTNKRSWVLYFGSCGFAIGAGVGTVLGTALNAFAVATSCGVTIGLAFGLIVGYRSIACPAEPVRD